MFKPDYLDFMDNLTLVVMTEESGQDCAHWPEEGSNSRPAPSASEKREDSSSESEHDLPTAEEAAKGDPVPGFEKKKEPLLEDEEGPEFSETPEEERVEMAKKEKAAGNEFFKNEDFQAAIDSYSKALRVIPRNVNTDDDRAIYYSNRSACYLKTSQWRFAVDDATRCLQLRPDTVKALLRRAQAYEHMEKYKDGLADMKRVVELDPSASVALAGVKRLERLEKERFEKEKDEMIGKLKDVGNTLLGKIGLSLDNFKMQKGPDGNYNISFQQ